MKKIAIEEHYFTQDYVDYLRSRKEPPRREIFEGKNHQKMERVYFSSSCTTVMDNPDVKLKPFIDIGEGRLKEMDRAGIDMQVLEISNAGIESFEAPEAKEWTRRTNDELARGVRKHPDRLAGLASLPFQEPAAAAAELERAVKELGLVGAVVKSHVRGEYLDDRKYWVVFEKAEELGVPIYLHLREPSPDIIKPFTTYPRLWTALWGFGAEAGLHVMRLLCSGVFDEYPRLKIIIGHMGEALPFWSWRLDRIWRNKPMGKNLKRKPSEYLRDNFAITTSGLFSVPAFLCAYLTLGADNIFFAVDYPHEQNDPAVQFMETLPICDSDKEKVYHLNAEKLFKLGGETGVW